MRTYQGRVAELQLDPAGRRAARIACPPQAVPAAGQYLLGMDEKRLLGMPLFQEGPALNGFLAAAPLPDSWAPGTPLRLYGPLGRGFRLPPGIARLALVAAGDGAARLMPLAREALKQNAAVTLYAEGMLPDLPLSVEAYPLAAAGEAAGWADFVAVEIPQLALPELGRLLGLEAGRHLPVSGQALVLGPMPCGGLADCGVCGLMARRSWKLACKDGPVFDLRDLLV
jgi:hypothetical protein